MNPKRLHTPRVGHYQQIERTAERVLQELLGPDRGKIDFRLGELLEKKLEGRMIQPGATFWPPYEGQKNPLIVLNKLKNPIGKGLKLGDVRDIQYRVAHETGHAKDFLHNLKGDMDAWKLRSRKDKEIYADKTAMEYFKKKGYKLGPTAMKYGGKQGLWAYSHFPGMAKRYGILPLLLLSLVPALAASGRSE